MGEEASLGRELAEAEDAGSRTKDLKVEMSKLRESMKSAASEKEQAGAEPRVASEASDDAIPPEVTSEEAAAAVFSGVTEKVMFARAVRDSPSPNEATRTRAARIFSGIPHRLSARALAARLGRDPSADVRKECVNGLTALGMKEQLPAVERALGDASGPVRLAAVWGVYRLAGAAGAVSLVRMFSDELEDVQRRAVACLGWLGQEDLAREVVPLLRGKSASVRLAALEALGNLKSPAVVDEVIGLLDDPEELVQRKAYQALRTITGKQMGRAFPEDENGRKFLVARWRAWREENPLEPAG